jgi:hypothetical protein
MARVIAFYVPASFKPAKQRPHGATKVVEFNSKTAKSNAFWTALEKMLPDLSPQTQR